MPEIKICEAIGACADLVVVRRLGGRGRGADVSISTPRDGSASLHANSSNEVADGIAWFTESVAGIAGRATLRGVIDKLAPLTGPIETPEVALMERDRELVELRKAALAYGRVELGLNESWMGGGPVAPADVSSVTAAVSALTDQAERYVAAHLRCLDFAAKVESGETFEPVTMCKCGHPESDHAPAGVVGLEGEVTRICGLIHCRCMAFEAVA